MFPDIPKKAIPRIALHWLVGDYVVKLLSATIS